MNLIMIANGAVVEKKPLEQASVVRDASEVMNAADGVDKKLGFPIVEIEGKKHLIIKKGNK